MKKSFLAILLSLNLCFGFAQDHPQLDFVTDLEFLKKTLPEKHTNLFAKITPLQFQNKVDQVAMRSNGMDQDRFIAELFKLAVAIGDEHTFVEVNFSKVLPIEFDFFKEGLFVVGIDSANTTLLNSQLESINGHPATEVIAKFKEVILHENPSFFEARFLYYLNNPVLLKGLDLSTDNGSAEFTFRKADGQLQKINLKAVAGNNTTKLNLLRSGKNLLSQQQKSNYWFTYDEAQQTLYFNYNKCREEENKPFNSFNDELFAAIEQYKPKKLVLDLRYNSGGNSGILAPFIEKIQQSELNKKNRFFVLIGKQTFSSALMNAVKLKRSTKATFIGEATSGNINHYGEVRGFALPKSKIVIAYSTRYWETWKGKKGPLLPDVAINYSNKNYAEGKDEALGYVYGKQ
jgi:hypothetical protein